MAVKGTSYEAEDTQVLEDMEHVRLRPGMYIADTGHRGYHQLLKEVFDNAIDEHRGGNGNSILVVVDRDRKTFMVQDRGRGVPIGIHPKAKIPALTMLFTMLHAGGKFHRSAYDKAVGLHGVGATATNALSTYMEVTSTRKHVSHRQRFERGAPVTKLTKLPVRAGHASGTRVEFRPDAAIFGQMVPDLEWVRKLLTNTCYLCPDLVIRYKTIVDGVETRNTISKKGGLRQMLKDRAMLTGAEFLHDIISYRDPDLAVALVWTKKEGERIHSFVNATPIPEGGTHVTGLRRVLTKVLGALTKDKFNTDDLRDGLLCAIHVTVSEPQFKGQTKTKLLNREIDSMVVEKLTPVLRKWVEEHKSVASMIVDKAVHLLKARSNYKKVASQLRNLGKASKRRGLLPSKLVESPFCDPAQREIFIVEGLSAGGSAEKARDASCQEVLSLKGKIPNAVQMPAARLLANTEIRDLIASLGCGIDHKPHEVCDPSKSRVGKVLLLMDADPDGQHITSLALAFLAKYMRPMISAGKIFVVHSPLFKASHKDRHVFGDSLDAVLKPFGRNVRPQVSRFKGHGEASAAEIREYAMSPQTRKIYQIQIKRQGRDFIMDLLGKDVKFRRKLLGLS